MKGKYNSYKNIFKIYKTSDINRILKTKYFSDKKSILSKLLKPKKNHISKKFLINKISLNNISNINNEYKPKLLNLKNSKISKSCTKSDIEKDYMNNKMKTTNSMNNVETTALYLKNRIIEANNKYNINKSKYKKLKKEINNTNNLYASFRLRENKQKIKDLIKANKNLSFIETHNDKVYQILNDNPLLLTKRKEIDSYYLNNANKTELFNHTNSKRIKFINKINDMLEYVKIKNNNLLDEKEKKLKLRQTNFMTNSVKRIYQEKFEKKKKLLEQAKKDIDISLKQIKETNLTLNTLNKNKSFLDDEIELRYKHESDNNSFNGICPMNLQEKSSSNIPNKEVRNDDSVNKNNKSLVLKNERRFSAINVFKEKSNYLLKPGDLKRSNSCLNINKNNVDKYNYLLEDDSLSKSKIENIYNEIKFKNVLLGENKEFVENYFKRRKFFLNKKPNQAYKVVSNSLYNINYFNLIKECKKMYGPIIPENIESHIKDLNYINKKTNKIRSKLFHSMCNNKSNNKD